MVVNAMLESAASLVRESDGQVLVSMPGPDQSCSGPGYYTDVMHSDPQREFMLIAVECFQIRKRTFTGILTRY